MRDERRRSRSPRKDSDHGRKRQRRDSDSRDRKDALSKPLPFNARQLTKYDLKDYRPLFAMYLDVQKQIHIEDLDDRELKGRWKSFMHKWNRCDLSEGYYDPNTKSRADARFDGDVDIAQPRPGRASRKPREASDESDDDYGPSLPDREMQSASNPNRNDLTYRDELDDDARQSARSEHRQQRKQERELQEQRMDELAPRAEPGTRERQMEKKREKAESNRGFREARSPGAEEIGDSTLMGGADGVEEYKAQLKANERRKTEREVRREEMLRVRAAEREERLSHHREKEQKTMDMLRELARQRFG